MIGAQYGRLLRVGPCAGVSPLDPSQLRTGSRKDLQPLTRNFTLAYATPSRAFNLYIFFDFLFSAPLVAEDCKHALKNFLTRVRSTAKPLALAKNFGRAIFLQQEGS